MKPVILHDEQRKPGLYMQFFEDIAMFENMMLKIWTCLKTKKPQQYLYTVIDNDYRCHRLGRILYRSATTVTMIVKETGRDSNIKAG